MSKPKDSREQASMPSVSENGDEGSVKSWHVSGMYVCGTCEASIFGLLCGLLAFFRAISVAYGVLCIAYVLVFALRHFLY